MGKRAGRRPFRYPVTTASQPGGQQAAAALRPLRCSAEHVYGCEMQLATMRYALPPKSNPRTRTGNWLVCALLLTSFASAQTDADSISEPRDTRTLLIQLRDELRQTRAELANAQVHIQTLSGDVASLRRDLAAHGNSGSATPHSFVSPADTSAQAGENAGGTHLLCCSPRLRLGMISISEIPANERRWMRPAIATVLPHEP